MIDDKDIPEEVKGDFIPEINPEKLFDEKEYATIILGDDVKHKKDIENADLVTALISNKASREEKDEALIALKANNASAFLIKAIEKTKNPDHKAILIAACWETGLDFSKNLQTFVELVAHSHFNVSFEAFTVIQEMDGQLNELDIKAGLEKLKEMQSENQIYIDDTIEFLQQQLNQL